MKANTALAFLLSGVSLWLLQEKQASQRRRRIGQVFAFIVAMLGLLTLSQYLFNWNLGIDQLVFREMPGAVGTSHLGRMAPTTALNFLLLGFALVLLSRRTQRNHWFFQLLTLSASLVALQPLLGYAYGVESVYGIASHTQMALHTVLSFMVLCVGILFARPHGGLMRVVMKDSTGGFIARRLLLAAIAIPSVLGYFIVQGYRAGLYNSAFGWSLLVMVSIIVFTVWIWQNAQTLDQIDTERKRTQEALQESEKRFRRLVESNIFGVTFGKFSGEIHYANDYFLKMVGYEREELLAGQIRWDQITPPEFLHLDAQAAEELRKHGVATPFEKEYIRKDGSRVPILIGRALLQEPYAQQQEMVGFFLNLAERKQAEAALRESEERFRKFFEEAPIGISVVDLDGRFLQVNRAYCQMLGYPEQELNQLTFAAITHPEDAENELSYAQQLFKGEIPSYQFEKRYIKKNGEIVWINLTATAIYDQQGKPRYGLGMVEDITDRKRNQLLLAAQNHVLEMIANGTALPEVLTTLTQLIEEQTDEAVCSILLLDQDRTKLYITAAPTLPESYIQAIKAGVSIGPSEGSCGTAAYCRESVIVSDIANDPLWAAYRDLPLSHGLRACWSTPIFASNGDLLGTFGMYYRTPRHPSEQDRKLVELSTHLAGVAIERQRAETTLQETNQTLEALIQACPLAITVFSLDNGKVKMWNPAAEKIFGWSTQEALGRFLPSVAEDKQDEFLANLDFVRQGRALTGLETRRQKKDGSPIDISVWAAPLCDAQGNVSCMSIVADISDRKQAQEALQQSEERFRKLTEKVLVIPWEADAITGKFTYIGPQTVEILGYPLSDWYTDNFWAEHIYSEDREWAIKYCIDCSAILDNYEFEYRMLSADGRVVWLYDIVNVVRSEGEPSLLRGFMIDITQRKQLEEEREQLLARERTARADAEAANRMKDEFLATLSHELRTPLNAMLGWTQMLRTRKFDEATTTRALETIDRNTKSLAALIEDVLDVSRIIRGKLHLNLRPVELVSVVEAAIDTVRSAAQAKEIRLKSSLYGSVEPILGDANRLQQVVWNLLSNAVKFTPKGGQVEIRLNKVNRPINRQVEQELQVENSNQSSILPYGEQPSNLQPSNSYVQLQVRDTGKGIAPEFLPYVFERFRQENSSTTRSYGGLGLGLAIVRHLVELHGGTVYADSPGEGQGATFSVYLPLVSVLPEVRDDSPSHSTIEANVPLDSLPELDGLRVLVVDDEADARELLTTILRQYKVEVAAVASAGEALEVLQRLKPNVLVSDIGMPGEDGYALIRKVRALDIEQGGQIPAVALTAYARAEDRIRALAAGFQLHIPKPVNPEELAAVVANLAQRTRKR